MNAKTGYPSGAPKMARKIAAPAVPAVRVGSGTSRASGVAGSSPAGSAPLGGHGFGFMGGPVGGADPLGGLDAAMGMLAGMGAGGAVGDLLELMQARQARVAQKVQKAQAAGAASSLDAGPFVLSGGECRLAVPIRLDMNGRQMAKFIPCAGAKGVEYVFEIVLRESYFRTKGAGSWDPEHVGIEPAGFSPADLSVIKGWGKSAAVLELCALELAMGFASPVFVSEILDGALPRAQVAWLAEHGLVLGLMSTLSGDRFVDWFDENPMAPVHSSVA